MLTLPDKILIGGLVIVTFLSFPAIRHFQHEGKRVVIELDGDVVGNFSLKDDRLVPVEGKLGTTWIKMAEGGVRIVDSPCPYKLCVKAGSIRMSGENVICLPNRVIVRIAGDDGEAVDAVSR
jgi:hypothetical protein